jgi:hypothetical protein
VTVVGDISQQSNAAGSPQGLEAFGAGGAMSRRPGEVQQENTS